MYEALKAANAKRFLALKVTKDYATIAKRLVNSKLRYLSVQSSTGVPWPIVAIIHERESSQNFNTQLAQGDPLSRKSTHVPKGQGPYVGAGAWERAALIALQDAGGKTWGDWSPGGWTTFLEKYNGLGYYNKGKPSPYVWAGTNQYKSGKYISDGVYSNTAVDTQPGCVALIAAMAKLDTSINPADLNVPSKIGPITAGAGAIVVGGTAVAQAAHPHLNWLWDIGIVGIICIVVGLGVYLYERNIKNV